MFSGIENERVMSTFFENARQNYGTSIRGGVVHAFSDFKVAF